jgi:chromosome segregation ATPase
LARRRTEQQPERISSPFTIGKVIDLSNTILGIKIDMNHYLKTITELHEENSDKQAQIDSLQAQLDKAVRKAEEVPREGPPRRESAGSKPKDEERRLRHEVEQLKLKCAHCSCPLMQT